MEGKDTYPISTERATLCVNYKLTEGFTTPEPVLLVVPLPCTRVLLRSDVVKVN